jgi:medium-chain acyl-[acyl-carrier-protein] hydrolase
MAAAHLEGRAFAEAVGFFGGLPPEVVQAEELHDLLLPTLRADFRLVADYRYREDEPLEIRVHLVNGTEDPHVRGDVLRGWASECREEPTRHEAVGGHFYFEQEPQVLTGLLRELAARAGVGVSTPVTHVEVI